MRLPVQVPCQPTHGITLSDGEEDGVADTADLDYFLLQHTLQPTTHIHHLFRISDIHHIFRISIEMTFTVTLHRSNKTPPCIDILFNRTMRDLLLVQVQVIVHQILGMVLILLMDMDNILKRA